MPEHKVFYMDAWVSAFGPGPGAPPVIVTIRCLCAEWAVEHVPLHEAVEGFAAHCVAAREAELTTGMANPLAGNPQPGIE